MLVRHADTITAAITAAESDLAATRDEITGTLRVAAFPTAARAHPARRRSPTLGRAHPRLRLTLRDLETRREPAPRCASDEVDLAVVDEYDEATRIREPGIELLELLDDPLRSRCRRGSGGRRPGPTRPAWPDEAWIMDTETSIIGGARPARMRTGRVRAHTSGRTAATTA